MKKVTIIIEDKGMLRPPEPSEHSEVLRSAVYALLHLVPPGCVVAYSDIARILGLSPRTVARILKSNKDPIAIPCHRVVSKDMTLGGYTMSGRPNPSFKRILLEFEGVAFDDKGRVSKGALECGRRALNLLVEG